jgi:hypothetical protein
MEEAHAHRVDAATRSSRAERRNRLHQRLVPAVCATMADEGTSGAAGRRLLRTQCARSGSPYGSAVTAPVCVCCAWPMGTLDVTAPGRDGLCLLCELAGCTVAVIGPGVVWPEVHRRPVTRRAGS